MLDKKHIRRRIPSPNLPIKIKRRPALNRRRKPHAKLQLITLTLKNSRLRPIHPLEILRPRKRLRRRPNRPNLRRNRGPRPQQILYIRIQPSRHNRRMRSIHRKPNKRHPMRKVIEHRPRSRHDNECIRKRHIRRRLHPNPLELPHRIIRKNTNRPTRKRQRRRIDPILRKHRPNLAQHLRIVIKRPRFEIIEPNERVPRNPVSPLDRLQQT